ncbi:MAG TPA: Ig-like domain-containing protein [Kofleriaceae bacterium]|jgi:hypothetical protein|nr:Ig-like domain-containing protein [Kofleriaceae bacterium]
MVRQASLICLLAFAACSFNRRDLDSRTCETADECEPQEDCTKGFCFQRPCQMPADCGPGLLYTCVSGGCRDKDCEADNECGAGFSCPGGYCAAPFNVQSAASTGNRSITVTFDAPPEPATAATLTYYSVAGLTLSGTPTVSQSTVTLTTSAQTAASYTLMVTNVVRNIDYASLTKTTATFTGSQ